jgi:sugar/nucleoside kinase (ribokinase family)
MLNEQVFQSSSLCVVGNLNRDIRLSPLVAGEYLFEDGETPVDWIAETVGGGATNSACAAAALGARVALLAKVGADGLGRLLEEILVRHGVKANLARSAGLVTGTSVNLTFTTGHRHFVSALPNNESLTLEDLDLSTLSEYGHLFRADVWFSTPMLYGGNEKLFREARQRGLRTSLDLNWDPQWGVANADEVRRRKSAVCQVLPWVNLVHGNVHELKEFTEAGDLEAALRCLVQWGAEAVVVHLGSEGAGCYERGKLVVAKPVPAAKQVNTTGTGDVLSVCMTLLDHRKDISTLDKLHLSNRIVSEYITGERKLVPHF